MKVMPNKSPILLLALVLFLVPIDGFSQEGGAQKNKIRKPGFLFWKYNRFDKQDRYHGRWKIYLGDDKTLIRNGRFRHGVEVGRWKYYYPDGTLYMLEKYNRRNNIIEVQKFHENGNLARKGTARIIHSTFKDHYYWFGDWQVFDKDGAFSHIETYKSGHLVRTTKTE